MQSQIFVRGCTRAMHNDPYTCSPVNQSNIVIFCRKQVNKRVGCNSCEIFPEILTDINTVDKHYLLSKRSNIFFFFFLIVSNRSMIAIIFIYLFFRCNYNNVVIIFFFIVYREMLIHLDLDIIMKIQLHVIILDIFNKIS